MFEPSCGQCVRCCPKITKCLKIGSKKFLGALCPLALNVIMVLNNNMLLDTKQAWYDANLDFFQFVMLCASILVFIGSLVFLIVGMIIAALPACFAACARACGAKSCSPLGIITAIFYTVLVFSLYFFSILGIVVIAVQIIEGLIAGEFPTGRIVANLLLIPPDFKISHPEFPEITFRIGAFRIGKVAGILPPIALDILSMLVSLFGFLTCRKWDQKYGASVDDLEVQFGEAEAELDAAQTEKDDAEAAKANLEKALALLAKGVEEYDNMKEQLAKATEKYDEAKAKYDEAKETFEKVKQILGKRKAGDEKTTTTTVANSDSVDARSVVAEIEDVATNDKA